MPLSPFLLVAGARPNFMKVAPLARVMKRKGIPFRLMHTGQHHDPALSDIFFRQLGLGRPDFSLEVGSGSHAQVTARVMERAEPILKKLKPRAVVVVGDVNSTLAMAMVSVKMHLPVAHVEAGLRSRDRTMPEETNRVCTDLISDLLLTPSADGDAHLRKEGIPRSRIARVGNVMIDSLQQVLKQLPEIPRRDREKSLVLMTFHRPSNVDDVRGLRKLMAFLEKVGREVSILLPLHPRTRNRLESHGLWRRFVRVPGLEVCEPMGYVEFVDVMRRARAVVTDSGGIQEETSHLGVPCLIMRTTTERPICITHGTAELMGDDFDRAARRLKVILKKGGKRGRKIPLWDGKAAERMVSALVKWF